MKAARISDPRVIKDIMPIHPMTALILKNIAVAFQSNQRSMKSFLQEFENGLLLKLAAEIGAEDNMLSDMPFIFKGGTCLMMLMDKPRRLSTDIDIIVEPGTDLDDYLEKASDIC